MELGREASFLREPGSSFLYDSSRLSFFDRGQANFGDFSYFKSGGDEPWRLLASIRPTQLCEAKCAVTLSTSSSLRSLDRPEVRSSLRARPRAKRSGHQRKVAFSEHPQIFYVESFKAFNLDTSVPKEPVATGKKPFCSIF